MPVEVLTAAVFALLSTATEQAVAAGTFHDCLQSDLIKLFRVLTSTAVLIPLLDGCQPSGRLLTASSGVQ